jgi:hypothetical protein
MYLVEMYKCIWQSGQHGGAIAAVRCVHIIAFKSVHEALGHPVWLRAVYWRVYWLDAQFTGQRVRLDRLECTSVIAQEFKRNRSLVHASKSRLHRLDHHVAYRLTRQAISDAGSPNDDLAVAVGLHEYAYDNVAVVASDLKAIRVLALVRFRDGYLPHWRGRCSGA